MKSWSFSGISPVMFQPMTGLYFITASASTTEVLGTLRPAGMEMAPVWAEAQTAKAPPAATPLASLQWTKPLPTESKRMEVRR